MADKLYKEYIKEFGIPDIIHAHNFLYAGIIAKFIKDEYGVNYIVTEHSSSFVRNPYFTGFRSKYLWPSSSNKTCFVGAG